MHSKIEPGNVFLFLLSLSLGTLFLPPLLIPIGNSTLTVYIGEIFIWLTAVLWVASVLKKGKITVTSISKYLFLLILVGIPSVFIATNIGRYLVGVMIYIEVFVIILIFSDMSFNQKLQLKYMKYFVYSSCILALFIISKSILENNGLYLIASKIKLDIGGSNYLASILMIPFLISLTNILKNKVSLVNVLLPSLFGVAIIFTASRTVLIILLILSLYFISSEILLVKRKLFKKVVSLTLLSAGAWIIYKLGNDFISQMIQSGRFNNLSEQSNLLSRFEIFHVYFDAFLKHPIIGNGYMNIKGALNISPIEQYFQAHNFILQTLGDNGIVALIILLGLLVTIFKFLSNAIKATIDTDLKVFIIGYRRGFVAVLLHGLLEPNFGSELFMLYLFIGLGIIIASTPKRSINVDDNHIHSAQPNNQNFNVVY